MQSRETNTMMSSTDNLWSHLLVHLAIFMLLAGCRQQGLGDRAEQALISTYPISGEKGLKQCRHEVDVLVKANELQPPFDLMERPKLPMPSRDLLMHSCMILNDGQKTIENAWNSAETENIIPMPPENSHSYGLADSIKPITQVREFIQFSRDFFERKIQLAAQSTPGWGVGFAVDLYGATVGVEAFAYDTPNEPKGNLLIAYYAYGGLSVGAPLSGYVSKAYGCETPESFTGTFLSGPFFGLGINPEPLVRDLLSGAFKNFRIELRKLSALTETLLSEQDVDKLSGRNLREYVTKTYASAVFLSFLTHQLDGDIFKDLVQITYPIVKNWRPIIDTISKDSGTTSITAQILEFLRSNVAGRESEFPATIAFLKSSDRYFSKCDALSLGAPYLLGLTYYVKFAELTPEDYSIITTGIGFREAFNTTKALRLIRAFTFFRTPALLRTLLPSTSAQVK
jgi:hypothetical protein